MDNHIRHLFIRLKETSSWFCKFNNLTMCLSNIIFWCFVLLLVTSFSETQENSITDDEQNDNSTVQNDPFISSMRCQNDDMELIRYKSQKLKNLIKNNEMQYTSKPYTSSTKNEYKNDSVRYESREYIKNHEESNQISLESCLTSTKINSTLQEIDENLIKIEDMNNSTLYHKLYGNSNTDYNNNMTTIVSYEACDNVTCIQLCCPFGNNLTIYGECVAGHVNHSFPDVYKYRNDSEDKKFDELFLTVRDPCVLQGSERCILNANAYLFLVNGSLYHGSGKLPVLPTSYCFAILTRNIYDVIVCTSTKPLQFPMYISACLLVSLPFLLLTFVVYSILPELQNMHGYTLRAHIGSLFISYTILYFGQQTSFVSSEKSYCIPLAYILNFFLLSSFLWLNVTCFDIWWTLRGFRLSRTNVKQEKKKFIMYSIYAWGISFVLTVICAIIDNVPGIPKYFIRPEICKRNFWYNEVGAKTIYFYVPMSAIIISNICFFIATLKILYQNKHTAHQLRDSESKRHNQNEQRLNMYMKLFIVMGISWVMELVSWFAPNFVPEFILTPTTIINGLQGLIIFIIFVCTKKIKQLLLKRFGRQNCGPFCKIPTNSIASNITSTSTYTMRSRVICMQEISPSN